MRNTAKFLSAAAFALLLAAGVQAAGQAPPQAPPQPTFRVNVDLVTTDVIVRDGKEQFISDLKPGEFEVLEAPALRAGKLAAAHGEHDRLDRPALAVKPEDVLVDAPVMKHGLAFDGLLDCADAVAQTGGFLELEALGARLHLHAHLPEQVEVLAFEQQRRRAQMPFIVIAIDRQAARSEASLDLVLQTRPYTVTEDRVRAGAQREDFADYVDGLTQSVSRAERSVVAATILDDAPGHGDARPGMIGDLGAEV